MNPFNLANVISLIFLFLYIGIGILKLVFPHYVWRITQKWKATNQPDPVYFLHQRAVGLLMVVVGAGLFVFVRTKQLT